MENSYPHYTRLIHRFIHRVIHRVLNVSNPSYNERYVRICTRVLVYVYTCVCALVCAYVYARACMYMRYMCKCAAGSVLIIKKAPAGALCTCMHVHLSRAGSLVPSASNLCRRTPGACAGQSSRLPAYASKPAARNTSAAARAPASSVSTFCVG